MKQSLLRHALLSALCLILTISLLVVPAGAAADASIGITGDAVYQYAWDILDRINAERAAAGVAPLAMDAVLLDAAMERAAECAVYYKHTRPDDSGCFTICDWRSSVGENIAAGYTSPGDVMDGWMDSQGHRENILSKDFQSVGIGVFQYNGFLFWVQFFDGGAPRTVEKSTQTKTVTRQINVSEKYVSLFAQQETNITLHEEETFQIESICNKNTGWEYTHVNLDKSNLAYTSANSKVATVSADGVISPTGNGSTTVSVFLPGCEGKAIIYTVTVEGISEGPVKGDVDGDGEITIRDAGLLRLHLADKLTGKNALTATQLKAADMDGDGEITVRDVGFLRLRLADKIK